MKHVITSLVKNESGVLSRVSNLFSGRGYNVETLTGAPILDEEYSKITVVTSENETVLEQIKKQLEKLIPVVKVTEMTIENSICKELVMMKIIIEPERRNELFRILELFDAKVLNIVDNLAYTIQIVGDERQIDSFIELMKTFEIKEFVRSGTIAISK